MGAAARSFAGSRRRPYVIRKERFIINLEIVPTLLMLEGNESTTLSEKGQEKYKELLINVFKFMYDIRWCSQDNCPCQPETRIAELLGDEELASFLRRERVLEFIDLETNKTTVFEKYGVR